jgi:hypothetical protein
VAIIRLILLAASLLALAFLTWGILRDLREYFVDWSEVGMMSGVSALFVLNFVYLLKTEAPTSPFKVPTILKLWKEAKEAELRKRIADSSRG